MNFVVPLQIGARDVAFPFLNNFSFWMTVSGAVTVMLSLFVGEFARTGWTNFTPLSESSYSPGVGVDYYIWSLQIAGIGTLLSGVNLIATIVKMRAPGMSFMKMPIFTWTALCTNVLIVAAFPILTAVLALLSLDRYLGFNFFTNDLGGNPMMYVNLLWIWGHPEVYILILPLFGVFSEVTSTFCGKRLFGYASMIYATVVITILAYLVWLHHFFTMGNGASVNSFFGITTMIISIPTGAKIFNWLFTMYKGRIRFELPMMWTVAFMITFVIGGMTGVLLAVPPADFQLHNSLFLVAHFHNVIIGGTFFGIMAGRRLLVAQGLRLQARRLLGQGVVLVLGVGLLLRLHAALRARPDGRDAAPEPLRRPVAADLVHHRGLRGAAGRLRHRGRSSIQIYVSIRERDVLADVTGDPWDGRTLEWSTSSPPPAYNFAFTPMVHDLDAWTDMKKRGYVRPLTGYKPIHMPKNTGGGRHPVGARPGLRLRHDLVHLVARGPELRRHRARHHRPHLQLQPGLLHLGRGGDPHRRAALAPARHPRLTEGRPMTRAPEALADDDTLKFYVAGEDGHGHAEGGTMIGFWLYLMSDCLIFAALFACYAVYGHAYAAGPSPADLFELSTVALNTALLLFSSITYGFAMLCMEKGWKGNTLFWMLVTALFRHGLRLPRAQRIRPPHPRGGGPAALGLPVVLLHPGRHPRPARVGRHPVDVRPHGAGPVEGARPREQAPPDVPQHVLAFPRRRVDRRLLLRLSRERAPMSGGNVAADMPTSRSCTTTTKRLTARSRAI